MIKLNSVKKIIIWTIPFVLTVAILLILFGIYGYAPFGSNSLASLDANIQYLDFFSYFKDVLSGSNNIAYSFSKMLGGNDIAVFSYYLSSPFNLLVVFFDKSNLTVFFDILIVLKLGAAATTAFIFLKIRFDGKIKSEISILLAVCYALCQYNIAQSSNIMWLDGVYMLPLILLGVYFVVSKKRICMLAICVGCSILINWYTGGINCLFSILWFIFEYFFYHNAERNESVGIAFKPKQVFPAILRYVIAMIIGVLLSAILFLPTLSALSGETSGIEWDALTRGMIGEIPSVVQAYSLGATSSYGIVSLFCGSLPLIGCIGCFFSKKISGKQKVILGALLCITITLFYFGPFYFLFSLFKSVGSYWYRYSYVGIFVLIFVAAWFYMNHEQERENHVVLKSSLLFSAIIVVFHYLKPEGDTQLIYKTVLVVIVVSIVLFLYLIAKRQKIVVIFLAAAIVLEMGYNTKLLMANYYNGDVTEDLLTYVPQQTESLEAIYSEDDGVYRISETSNRYMQTGDYNGLTANYNEAMAYGYWSNATYTSATDQNQLGFLNLLGYKKEGVRMSIVNTSIVGADSLLGVKYVLSKYPINGLEKTNLVGEDAEKDIYYNPYALPFAFTFADDADIFSDMSGDGLNPFEYQNQLYSRLLGKDVTLYTPVEFETEEQEDTIIFILDIENGNYAFYGNITWQSYMMAVLNVNDEYEINYSQFISPSVFYIPTNGDDDKVEVSLTFKNNTMNEAEFYMLDLDMLQVVTDEIKSRAADHISVMNGQASFEVSGQDGENLYISIPYDSGWTITLNGKSVEPELIADCMITVPLEDGDNQIEMVYHVPYFKAGVCFTLIGGVLLLAICLAQRKKEYR